MHRIGILGGTFDPPHFGHLAMAEAGLHEFALDEVILIPTARNPLKERKRQSSPRDRLEMTRLAIRDRPNLSVSDIEVGRSGFSYTVDTLEELNMVRPADYWFLIGSDALKSFTEWKNPHRILQLCRLGVCVRPPDTREKLEENLADWVLDRIDWIGQEVTEISSTRLRSIIQEGRSTQQWLDPAVREFIDKHRLYQ